MRLGADDATEAGRLIARAFADDPLLVHLLPERADRLRLAEAHLVPGVRLLAEHGEVWRTPDYAGVACWVPPRVVVPWPPREVTRERLAAAVGAEPATAFLAAAAHLGERAKAIPLPPHWYLALLAVEPGRQGQGVGSALLAPVLARADAAGEPVRLETVAPRNVPFYERHGFAVAETGTEPNGLPYWLMVRSSR